MAKTYLVVDDKGNTVHIPKNDMDFITALRKQGSANVVQHKDKRELWQYICDYMKGNQE